MRSWDLDDFLAVGFTAIVFTGIILLFIAFTSNHSIRKYYLNGGSSTQLQIGEDINWAPDNFISLDRNISYADAVKLVNELNAGIPKKDLNLSSK